MATAWVTEYTKSYREPGMDVDVPLEPAIRTQVVSFTTTAATAAAFTTGTTLVRIITDADAHYIVAVAPVATTSHAKIPAGLPEFFGVSATGQLKVAFVAAS